MCIRYRARDRLSSSLVAVAAGLPAASVSVGSGVASSLCAALPGSEVATCSSFVVWATGLSFPCTGAAAGLLPPQAESTSMASRSSAASIVRLGISPSCDVWGENRPGGEGAAEAGPRASARGRADFCRQLNCRQKNTTILPMHHNWGADRSPGVEPGCIGDSHVDAAVAHRMAEIVMPVGAMDGVGLVEIHDPRQVGEVVAGPRNSLRTK